MNVFVLEHNTQSFFDSVATMVTSLLDSGAEFSKFVATKKSTYLVFEPACRLIELANPLDFIDGTPNQPDTLLSPALIHSRSPRRQ